MTAAGASPASLACPEGSESARIAGLTAECPEHHRPLIHARQTAALAVVLGWHESTVLHACEGRLDMMRGAATVARRVSITVDRPSVQPPCSDCTIRWGRDDDDGIKHSECFYVLVERDA